MPRICIILLMYHCYELLDPSEAIKLELQFLTKPNPKYLPHIRVLLHIN
jgi:hypothetical protein